MYPRAPPSSWERGQSGQLKQLCGDAGRAADREPGQQDRAELEAKQVGLKEQIVAQKEVIAEMQAANQEEFERETESEMRSEQNRLETEGR